MHNQAPTLMLARHTMCCEQDRKYIQVIFVTEYATSLYTACICRLLLNLIVVQLLESLQLIELVKKGVTRESTERGELRDHTEVIDKE
jgi:hypothetical protein